MKLCFCSWTQLGFITFIKLPNCRPPRKTFGIFIIGDVLNSRWPRHVWNNVFIMIVFYIQFHLYIRSIVLRLNFKEEKTTRQRSFSREGTNETWYDSDMHPSKAWILKLQVIHWDENTYLMSPSYVYFWSKPTFAPRKRMVRYLFNFRHLTTNINIEVE